MYLIYDTETTGLPQNFNAPITDLDNWPRLVQIAWQLHDENGYLIEAKSYVVRPEGFTIPFNAAQVHGITTAKAEAEGQELEWVLDEFIHAIERSQIIVGHNIEFDQNIMGAEFIRKSKDPSLLNIGVIDTKNESTEFCAIPGGRGGKFKWPTLTELHDKLFDEPFDEAHNAIADVEATTRCFFKLCALRVIHTDPPVADDVMEHLERAADVILDDMERRTVGGDEVEIPADDQSVSGELSDVPFAHLHVHSQYSILEATIAATDLVKLAAEHNMPAVAMTDRSFMYGAFHFTQAVNAHNKSVKAHNAQVAAGEIDEPEKQELKGIVGVEFHLAADMRNKHVRDHDNTIVVLAKNKEGYRNLSKLSSLSITEGMYYVPRIDKSALLEYREGLMVLSGALTGELTNTILNVGETQAENALLWYAEHFGDDFYVELNRHGLPEEEHAIEVLVALCKKHNVKYIAANNVYYGKKGDANAHDVLLCIRDGERQSTPKGKGRGFRYGLPNDEFYFKSQDEMKTLFHDLPDSIRNIGGVVEKVENYVLARDVLLPKFEIPDEFKDPKDDEDGGVRGENNFLRHLTYEGAKGRYGEITEEIRERLDFELSIIEKTGYPGYFLIVQDFTTKAREMGVSVGPGRGSAAGSAVAYCVGITNVDPIKYDLLFERFLNPERVSLPDIDIDFDDEGRSKVIQYVIDKYGINQVAQIITYGTMKAKSAIRDAARALDLPLGDADRLAKLMPSDKLGKLLAMSDKEVNEEFKAEEAGQAKQLITISKEESPSGLTLRMARDLEGTVRNTGIHACGVIITPTDIRELIPVTTAKDAELLVTQFDNSVVEDAGLLKMDFLGLKTLTIIRKAVEIIKRVHGKEIDPEAIALDDAPTYELFQRGDTVGIFQFESPGMQKYLKELEPDKLEDLIAMNALYRPGPLQYIPDFIDRKHGRKEIAYDLPDMKGYLEETYGITVYQEQVMLLSQQLANFTKGQADALRKGMGKKKKDVIDALYPIFIENGVKNGHPEDVLNKIWKDWEEFASYAFNKSHSTCYAYIAYQTAYFKANYTAEFMAAVLSNNMNNIKEVTLFMEECNRLNIPILGPDVNDSEYDFTVQNGAVRFGMVAVKGVGSNAVKAIIEEREENGPFKSIFDLTSRVNLSHVNRKTLENLALSGAFDCFENHHRSMFFSEMADGRTFMEAAVRYGQQLQNEKNNNQMGLFGSVEDGGIQEPELPNVPQWNNLIKLKKEEEVTGIFISSHPLADFRTEMTHFCNINSEQINREEFLLGKEYRIGGMVRDAKHLESKNGNGWGMFKLMDMRGSHEFKLFGEDYMKYRHFLSEDAFIYVEFSMNKREYRNKQTNEMVDAGIRMKYIDIKPLSNIIDTRKNGIHLRVHAGQLNSELIDRLDNVFNKHRGNELVKVELYDPELKQLVPLHSKRKVETTRELLEDLSAIREVVFKMN